MNALAERYEPILADQILGVTPLSRTSTRILYPTVSNRQSYYSLLTDLTSSTRWLMMLPTATAAPQEIQSPFLREMDRMLQSLERLQDGWNGGGSIAPNAATLNQLQLLIGTIPPSAAVPEIEVEDDTGSVTMRWASPQFEAVFAFVVTPDGSTVGVKTVVGRETRVYSKKFAAGDSAQVARHIEDDDMIATALNLA
jgi:hypothetical protein